MNIPAAWKFKAMTQKLHEDCVTSYFKRWTILWINALTSFDECLESHHPCLLDLDGVSGQVKVDGFGAVLVDDGEAPVFPGQGGGVARLEGLRTATRAHLFDARDGNWEKEREEEEKSYCIWYTYSTLLRLDITASSNTLRVWHYNWFAYLHPIRGAIF